MNDYSRLIEEVGQYTKTVVKKSRYEHCERVAEMCAKICRLNGMNEEEGYLAGIGHDMCKECSGDELIELAKRYGKPVLECEMKTPSFLHGRAAAVVMKEKFYIDNKNILEAVAYHIHGVMGMCNLTKALFLADKIEPKRPQSTEDYRSNLLKLPLDEMFVSVFEENMQYIIKKGYVVFPGTPEILKYYKNELGKKNA